MRHFYLFFLLLAALSAQAQKPKILEFWRLDTSQSAAIARVVIPDTATAEAAAEQQIARWIKQGHIMVSVDSFALKDSVLYAFCYLGPRYIWAELRPGNVDAAWLQSAGYRAKNWSGQPFGEERLTRLMEDLLRYSEEHGLPFARLRLDSLELENGKISAALYLDAGPLIQMGGIALEKIESRVDGTRKDVTARITKRYLGHYLGIRRGQLYNERTIQKMQTRLNALPFLQTERPPYIVFAEDKAEPHFFLRQKRASRFDFLVGVQPNDNPLLPQQRQVTLTGNVLIDLQNALGRGERLMLAWQRFKVQTSQLRTKAVLPYLFGLPFGADMSFELYRRDSTYVDIIGEAGFQYLLQGGNYLKFYWRNAATNLTWVDTARLRVTRQLPSTLDLSTNWLGVEYYWQGLDYRFNPRKGLELRANLSAGRKHIRPNIAILNLTNRDFDFSTLYDSLPDAWQARWQSELSCYWPMAKRATFLTRLQTGFLWSSRGLYRNELFRIGGSRIQRGFDEELIFASAYAAFTAEARYLFARNSYFFAFADATAFEERSAELHKRAYPYSAGLGLALETKIGVFGLSYALGTYVGEPLQVRNAKIHFGYVNMF